MVLLLYFLLLLTVHFTIGEVEVEVACESYYLEYDYPPGIVIDVDWLAEDIWWFAFPVVLAYSISLFSYELDTGVLETYLLSSVKRSTIFTAKLSAIFTAILLPLLGCLLLSYPLADPLLFQHDPMGVYINLPPRLLLYASMLYIMICISVFSATVFRKPLYAFILPTVTLYILNMTGIFKRYIPPSCFYYPPGFPCSLGVDVMTVIERSMPAIIFSTIMLILSYFIFNRKDIV